MYVGARRTLLSASPQQVRGTRAYMDFASGGYWLLGRRVAPSTLFGNARATATYGQDAGGTLFSAPSGSPLIAPSRGLWSSSQRINSAASADMAGAAEGSPGTLPASWAEVSRAGLSRTITLGSDNGMPYIDLRYFGTTTDANGVSLTFNLSTAIAASNGQTWSQSLFARLVGGSFSNVSQVRQKLFQRNSSNVFLSALDSADFKGSLGTSLFRPPFIATTTEATIAYMQHCLAADMASGVAVDFTLRLQCPQTELGAYVTAPIPKGATQRNADLSTFLDPAMLPAAGGSVMLEWEEVPGPVGISRHVLVKRIDGSNYLTIGSSSAGKARLSLVVGGVSQADLQSANSIAAGNIYRIAARIAPNDVAMAVTSGLNAAIIKDASASMLPSEGALDMGAWTGTNAIDSPIRKIITTAALKSDAELLAWAQAA